MSKLNAMTPNSSNSCDLTTWKFEQSPIRQIFIDGEPWFVAKDVCAILGYTNSRDALAHHVHDDDKGVEKLYTPGGAQNLSVINESGVYALIFGSKLPKAKEFKHWVTSIVLPKIRKTGMYATPKTAEEILRNPKYVIAIAKQLLATTERVSSLEAEMENMVEDPVHLVKRIADQFAPDIDEEARLSVRYIAHMFGRDARWLNTLLETYGVQHKGGDGVWRLNDEIAGKGFRKEGLYRRNAYAKPCPTSFWTKTGLQFIIALLHEYGIEPTEGK